jgi:hypothetical protein
MAIAVGSVVYTCGEDPVVGRGVAWTAEELDSALAGSVAEVLFDDNGTADLNVLLSSLTDTGFEQEAVRRILEADREPENWRVGEALAETYLVCHCDCHFPWPDSRDERKSGSSLPGADFVGFCCEDGSDRFAFGEVKTSSDSAYPPTTTYGRTGLKKQLEDLRDNDTLRNNLVKYLGYRASAAPWQDKYKRAVMRYLKNSSDISVFGVMVRDVVPNQLDVHARVVALGSSCPESMAIRLFAIYLPQESINTLSSKVIQFREGGDK